MNPRGFPEWHDTRHPKPPVSFQQAIMQTPNFRRGVYSTGFIDQLLGGARRESDEEKT